MPFLLFIKSSDDLTADDTITFLPKASDSLTTKPQFSSNDGHIRISKRFIISLASEIDDNFEFFNDGIELNRFYANPVCSPTRASLLTGLHIFNHGVVRPFMNPAAEQTGMPPELKIMPEYFREAGYQTALSGKWHLGMAKEEFWPTNRGFDTSYGHMSGGIGYFDHTASGRLDWHRNEKP